MNEYPKDILFDIDMQLYDEFNDKIAKMYDYLGEVYSQNDINEVLNAEKEKEIKLVREAVRRLQKRTEELQAINQMQKYRIEIMDERELISRDEVENIIKIKIEEYEEKFKAENGKKTINYHLYRIIIDEVLKPFLDKIKGDDK